MAAVASGKLRHKVELQANVPAQDPVTGEMRNVWTTIARPWADIVPMSAREFFSSNAEQSEVRGRMTIRYREDIDATMRVLHRGMIYAIHGVMPDADSGREHMTIMTGEGVRLAQ